MADHDKNTLKMGSLARFALALIATPILAGILLAIFHHP